MFEILEDGKAIYSITSKDGKVYNTPEQRGFQQKIQFETVALLPTFENEQGVMTATETLFHTIMEIDMAKFAELNNKEAKYEFGRAMASGIFAINWRDASNRGTSTSGPIALFKDDRKTPMPYVKITSRTPITKNQAKMILRHLCRTATPDVMQYINS